MFDQKYLSPGSNWFLMGVKGVAMTSLAQILVDAGMKVSGADVAEDFVTAKVLGKLNLKVTVGFENQLPENVQVLVYTAAHQGQFNPLVAAARGKGIPTLSQAEALSLFHNQKQGIAVCGVGGKSTVSAMITWILEKIGWQPSFSVGVGNIPGLDKTGCWRPSSDWFVTEADEYVIDPSAPSRNEPIIPRFSFLQPFVTVCTNLEYDHPDVYQDFGQTQTVFKEFFNQIKPNGKLVINFDSMGLNQVVSQISNQLAEKQIKLISFGEQAEADWQLTDFQASQGITQGNLKHDQEIFQISLSIPGKFNLLNAAAAVATVVSLGASPKDAIQALKNFPSTLRRFEKIGVKNGVTFYDDYGHHPHEIAAAIKALADWFPDSKKIIAFQSHTFSRTKQLFDDFVTAFAKADEVVMIDIFPSAREAYDATVSSDSLCATISAKYPEVPAKNLKTLPELAAYLKQNLKSGDVCLTIGAGDIYHVHELL